jgi:hypothetical protein
LPDGRLRWKVTGMPAVSLSTPVVADGLLFVTLSNPIGDLDENIVKLPPFDELLKKYDTNKDGKLSKDEIPADMVLFTRGRADKIGDWARIRDVLGRFDKNKDGALDRQEWQGMLDAMSQAFRSMRIAVAAIRLDGTNKHKPEVAWQVSKFVPEVPSPLYYQGRLYLVNERGIITCRDAKTGKEIYRERLGGQGSCYSSPVAGGKKIYMASEGGIVVVFQPGDRYKVLAKNDMSERILATPSLVDNTIYLRTDRHLYAFAE